MVSRQFLSWADQASAGERADAARDLARAFLYADLDRRELNRMERAMTCLLDDPSHLVRRALAEALAGAAHAPHHLVAALAGDQAAVAAVVLGRSPVLTDADLIDAAALGEGSVQCAIAIRPALSAAVSGALAEVAGLDALLTLCRNHGAALADVSIRRMLERFGRDGDLRTALASRRDLCPTLRHDLVVATAEALRRFVIGCGWMTTERARRVAGEACDRATVALAGDAAEQGMDDPQHFAAHLRVAGHLTPALVMRAVMSGQMALFEGALAELTGQPLVRVRGLVRRSEGLGFAALVHAAGLPDSLLPILRTALGARLPASHEAPAVLRREVVAEVLASFTLDRASPLVGLMALLRRFEVEAARDESRVASAGTAPHRRIEPRFDAVLDLAAAA